MSSASIIRNSSLAPSGADKITWVWNNMPLLRAVREDFEKEQPLAGLKVALSVHLEAKTACLCKTLAAGGAEVYATGSNPLSTQRNLTDWACMFTRLTAAHRKNMTCISGA